MRPCFVTFDDVRGHHENLASKLATYDDVRGEPVTKQGPGLLSLMMLGRSDKMWDPG